MFHQDKRDPDTAQETRQEHGGGELWNHAGRQELGVVGVAPFYFAAIHVILDEDVIVIVGG